MYIFNQYTYKHLQCNNRKLNAVTYKEDLISWPEGFIQRIQSWFNTWNSFNGMNCINRE